MKRIILVAVAVFVTLGCVHLAGGGVKMKCAIDAYFQPTKCYTYPYLRREK
jgi:hypothetical protein